MNKKKILIIVLLFIIGLIGFGYYKTFFFKPSNSIFICGNNTNKYYSTDNKNKSDCTKVNFKCKDCLIYDNYLKDRIIYSTKDKINIYDLINKKNIVTLKVSKTYYKNQIQNYPGALNFYTQNSKTYGFIYKDDNDNNTFYNINDDVKTILNKAVLCSDSNAYSNFSCGNNIINNDMAIVVILNDEQLTKFGVINLKTGEYVIQPNKLSIIHNADDNYYIIPYQNDTLDSKSIYDNNLKPIFINNDNNKKLYYTSMIRYLGNDIIIAENDYNLTLFNTKGEKIEDLKLKYSDIDNEIKKKITNEELKKELKETPIVFGGTSDDLIIFRYYKEENAVDIFVHYTNSYYEQKISLNYRFDLNVKKVYRYEYPEECLNSDCGKEDMIKYYE